MSENLTGGASITTNEPLPVAPEQPSKWHSTFLQITQGNALISVLAVVLALIVGGIMIAFTDEDVQAAAQYFFARPMDTSVAICAMSLRVRAQLRSAPLREVRSGRG